jgi:hypothetical protein
MPALAKTMSTPPNRSTVSSNRLRTAASSDVSASQANASPPACAAEARTRAGDDRGLARQVDVHG